MSDVYVVVSAATTCDETNSYVPPDSTELILLSWAIVDASTLQQVAKNHTFVRPTNTPITPWCTQKYGISWEHVRNAGTFRDAVGKLEAAVAEHVGEKEFSFVSYDGFPLRVHIPREARDKSVELAGWLRQPRVFELRREFARVAPAEGRGDSLAEMVAAVERERETREEREDRETEKKDEERETEKKDEKGQKDEKVVEKVSETSKEESKRKEETKGETKEADSVGLGTLESLTTVLLELARNPALFTAPYDLAEDLLIFKKEQSKILNLKNLPPDTTQSELESWFTQFGGRPIAFWTVKGDTHNLGFAVFATHEEATEALSMNGRVLGDRAIEVQPSSTSVLDRASQLLTPFPVSKNRPRPGDWTCPSCGFSNFQRRTACFRCSFPATSAVTVVENYRNNTQPSPGTKPSPSTPYKYNVPFRAGDWKCTNEACQYHNFAKNITCLKCGGNKPSNVNNHMMNMNNQYSSVNSTAAAIAAATASGQPLNFSNNMQMPIVSMQQQLQQLHQNQNQNPQNPQNQGHQNHQHYPRFKSYDYYRSPSVEQFSLAEQVNGMSLQ